MTNRDMIYVGDHTALTRTVFGHKMYVDTRDVSLSPHILMDGDWEPWTGHVLQTVIKPGMVVVDVGANMGFFSLLMAQLVGPTGKLFSFEANPDIFRLLARNIEINGFRDRAACEQVGVMDQRGSLTFSRLRDHLGSSSFFMQPDISASYHDQIEEISVRCVSLDEYFDQHLETVDVMKIDVEGAETEVIRGARRLLERSPNAQIVLEYTPGRDGQGGNMAAVESLIDMGFDMWAIDHESRLERTTFDTLARATDLVMLYTRRVDVSGALRQLPETRKHAVLAFADELISNPSLLADYGRRFSGDDDVSLVVYAPGQQPSVILQALQPVLQAAGLDQDDTADMVACFTSPSAPFESQLAKKLDAVFSQDTVRAPFRHLPRLGQSDLQTWRHSTAA